MSPHPRPLRVNGIAVLAALVVGGLGITAGYYRFRAPRLYAQAKAEREALSDAPEARLERWFDFGAALIHQRLVQLRLSPRQPWLVTHTVAADRNSPDQEIWGVDFTDLAPEWTAHEGMRVVVTLPPPRLLGHGPIGGDMARNVPHVTPGTAFDPQARGTEVVEWALKLLVGALERDIPGASLEVRYRVEGASSPEPSPAEVGARAVDATR